MHLHCLQAKVANPFHCEILKDEITLDTFQLYSLTLYKENMKSMPHPKDNDDDTALFCSEVVISRPLF